MEDKIFVLVEKIRLQRADLSQRLRDLEDYQCGRANPRLREMELAGVRDPERELYIIIGYIQREIRRLEIRASELSDEIAYNEGKKIKTHV